MAYSKKVKKGPKFDDQVNLFYTT